MTYGSFRALLTGEGLVRRGGDVEPRGGMEMRWRTANGITLIGRGGLRAGQDDDLLSRGTFGGGIGGAHVMLDYAYQGMGAMGGAAHRVGIRFAR